MLGATVQMGTSQASEWEKVRAKAWSAYHLRKRFWRVKGRAAGKLRMLHLGAFPVINWCAGARFWTQTELRSARSFQLHMCRRAAQLWPRQDEAIADYNRRIARWCESVLRSAALPRWDSAVLSSWWRWAGQAARQAVRFPETWLAQTLAWMDARPELARSRSGRPSVGRGLRGQGKRRWDDPLQAVVDSHYPGTHRPWSELAQHRDQWKTLEARFVQRALRISTAVLEGRFMAGPTP